MDLQSLDHVTHLFDAEQVVLGDSLADRVEQQAASEAPEVQRQLEEPEERLAEPEDRVRPAAPEVPLGALAES